MKTDDDSDDSEMRSNESSNVFVSFETESTADKRMSRLLGEMLSDVSEEDGNVNCESSAERPFPLSTSTMGP